MQKVALAVLLIATALASLPNASALAANPFDGQWSVEVVTDKGACDRAYRWDLLINDGRVAAGADMPAAASGSVSPRGVVAVRFSRGSDSMTATGSASGKWATGQWTSPSLACSGRWTAERRA